MEGGSFPIPVVLVHWNGFLDNLDSDQGLQCYPNVCIGDHLPVL